MADDRDDELTRRQEMTRQAHQALFDAVRARLPELEGLLEAMNYDYEDRLYRFYHQSFKVYYLQGHTTRAADLFRGIAQVIGGSLNPWFEQIVTEGTGVEFEPSHNRDWLAHTRPQVEAFLHAKYFVEVIVKYGREMAAAPHVLPSGWAAVLSLFGLR